MHVYRSLKYASRSPHDRCDAGESASRSIGAIASLGGPPQAASSSSTYRGLRRFLRDMARIRTQLTLGTAQLTIRGLGGLKYRTAAHAFPSSLSCTREPLSRVKLETDTAHHNADRETDEGKQRIAAGTNAKSGDTDRNQDGVEPKIPEQRPSAASVIRIEPRWRASWTDAKVSMERGSGLRRNHHDLNVIALCWRCRTSRARQEAIGRLFAP